MNEDEDAAGWKGDAVLWLLLVGILFLFAYSPLGLLILLTAFLLWFWRGYEPSTKLPATRFLEDLNPQEVVMPDEDTLPVPAVPEVDDPTAGDVAEGLTGYLEELRAFVEDVHAGARVYEDVDREDARDSLRWGTVRLEKGVPQVLEPAGTTKLGEERPPPEYLERVANALRAFTRVLAEAVEEPVPPELAPCRTRLHQEGQGFLRFLQRRYEDLDRKISTWGEGGLADLHHRFNARSVLTCLGEDV